MNIFNYKTIMGKIFVYSIVALLSISTFGCNRETESNGKVEFYLLDSFSTLEKSCQINDTTVTTKSEVLVNYSDIISYDSDNYIFELSDAAVTKIKNLDYSVNGLAFAVKANEELIYTGYFWPGFSSASCAWLVIDPISLSDGKAEVKLGYPTLYPDQYIEDKRNDERIIDILKLDNKLK